MKTNSLLIIDPVGKIAGMDYYDLNLAEALIKNGVQVYIASNFEKNKNCLKFFDSQNKRSKAAKMYDLMRGFTKAISFAKKNGIQNVLVHVFTTELKDFLPISLVKMANLKLIVIAHDISGFANTDLEWTKNIIFNKFADSIIVHNKYSQEALKKVIAESALSKVGIIPHGSFINLSLPEITREKAREDLKIAADQKVILFFGQIKKVKGLDVLLNAMPMVRKDVSLIIAGRVWRDDFLFYQKLIDQHQLSDRVKLFIRYIDDYERELFFKAADLLIIPYRKIYQSGVLLMGMSYKLPVMASDVEANAELIQSGYNGMLFKNGDVEDLSQKINQFFEKSSEQLIVNNAFHTMQENHNWNEIALEYKKLLCAYK
jgi:glycosyltransferase involved in cell wall biosynthesis